jgi:hypothetical protein
VQQKAVEHSGKQTATEIGFTVNSCSDLTLKNIETRLKSTNFWDRQRNQRGSALSPQLGQLGAVFTIFFFF